LVENHQLEAVVKLPAGVFKPYAGVSTAILFFTKEGKTTDVWFYDVQADGFTLDDKRTRIDNTDLPDVRDQWAKWSAGKHKKQFTDRTAKAFYVPKDEIADNGYDLSLNRYKEIVYEEEAFDPPKVIIGRLRKLEEEIAHDLDELEAMLG
jgi:type I restriction enzyme M protein